MYLPRYHAPHEPGVQSGALLHEGL